MQITIEKQHANIYVSWKYERQEAQSTAREQK